MTHNSTMRRTASAFAALVLLLAPTAAVAQVVPPEPIPCPWWQCDGPNDVVVELYRVDTTIEGPIATTRITQVLRNDGRGLAEGQFLMPIPAEAAVTGLTLWIDGEAVSGELLDGDAARRTYEQIVRDTLDPALLEFVDDDLLQLSVFPIPAGVERTVEVEYRQILRSDAGLVRYRQPMGREHRGIEIEQISARIEVYEPSGLKAIHSPTSAVSIDRVDENTAVIGYESSSAPDGDFVVYWSTDVEPVSVDVLSYRDGNEGWFLLLASPGIAPSDAIIPKDVVLVLDVSGSMEGEKLAQARRAATVVLDDLNPDDRLAVLAFSTGVQAFSQGLRPAPAAGEATAWVGSLAAGGSTNIAAALARALELSEPGRPLYVMFMTDGLPTEGLVDTEAILGSLKPSETVSVFAFGVGYDVDTVLLDSIARQHHGTAEYVVPGEDIDAAMASLSSKIASPVMTAVQLEIDGVTVSDTFPNPLPDLFSGGQLALTGRYDGWGPATITLRGRLQGESVEIVHDDVRFSAAGGDATIPSLWATRKIGALLRSIRIDGPNEETIDQIVRISIRHGIITPYTSYLVTETAPFGEDAIADISRSAAASATTMAASGEASVSAADAAAELSASNVVVAPSPEYREVITRAAGRTFRFVDGAWLDTAFDPEADTVRVAFGSDDYFALARADKGVAQVLALGSRVVFPFNGTTYEIVEASEAVDALVLPPPAITSGTTSAADPEAPSPILLGAGAVTQQPGNSALLALAAALGVTGFLVVVAGRRH